jgi:hypothetical protein
MNDKPENSISLPFFIQNLNFEPKTNRQTRKTEQFFKNTKRFSVFSLKFQNLNFVPKTTDFSGFQGFRKNWWEPDFRFIR